MIPHRDLQRHGTMTSRNPAVNRLHRTVQDCTYVRYLVHRMTMRFRNCRGRSGTRLADESDHESIACLIRAEQGTPPSSGTAPLPRIFTPGQLSSCLFTPPVSSPLLLSLHACPFTDAPLVHTGRPLGWSSSARTQPKKITFCFSARDS